MAKNGISVETEVDLSPLPVPSNHPLKLRFDPNLYIQFATYHTSDTIGHLVTPARGIIDRPIGIVERKIAPIRDLTLSPEPPQEVIEAIFDHPLEEEPIDEATFLINHQLEQTTLARVYARLSEALFRLTLPVEIKQLKEYGFSLEPTDYRQLLLTFHQQLPGGNMSG